MGQMMGALGHAVGQFGTAMGNQAMGVPPGGQGLGTNSNTQKPQQPGLQMGDIASLFHQILFNQPGQQSGQSPVRQISTDDPGAPGY